MKYNLYKLCNDVMSLLIVTESGEFKGNYSQ